MTRDDVIDLLTVIAATDRRTVGEADVAVWQQILGGLRHDLALRAVIAHYRERPGVWLEPGHVVAGARTLAYDERQREAPDDTRRREAALDARVAESVAAIVERTSGSRPALVRRPPDPRRATRCSWCGVGPGARCISLMDRQPMDRIHPSRYEGRETPHPPNPTHPTPNVAPRTAREAAMTPADEGSSP